MDSFMYQPTPLEEAYAQYLIRTVFPQPSDAVTLRISGRHAVPFLSQSGLPRDILRNLWSCVDPHTTGYLSDVQQFYTLLRLVSLAQCHMIDASSNLQQCCFETAHRTDLPLATFHGYPIPDALTLMSSYSTTSVPPPSTPSVTTLPTDPFPSLHNGQEMAPIYPPHSYPQQPSLMTSSTPTVPLKENAEDEEFGAFTTTPSTVTVGAWDALDQLVTVEDAPLPSLPTGAVTGMEEEDFGTFSAAVPATSTSLPVVGEEEDFGTFAGADVVGAAHDFGLMQGSSTDGIASLDWNTSSSAGVQSIPSSNNLFDPVSSTPQQFTLPALHPIANDPGLPAPVGVDVFSSPIIANDGMTTEHHLPTTLNTGVAVASNAFDDPFSAFDAIASVTDSALPELIPEGASVPLNSSAIAPVVTDDSEGFGDFTAANAASLQPIVGSFEPTKKEQTDDFGDFLGTTEKDAAVVATHVDPHIDATHPDLFKGASTGNAEVMDSLFPVAAAIENDWTALDALVETKDAPLPLLQPTGFSSLEAATTFNSTIKPDESESEGFGEFVGINEIQENVGDTKSLSSMPLGSEAYGEILPPTADYLQNGSSALDTLLGHHETPPSIGGGDLSVEQPEIAPAVVAQCDGTPVIENNWTALDALVETKDVPLPLLQPMGLSVAAASTALNPPIKTEESESEGFGDFVGINEIQESVGDNKSTFPTPLESDANGEVLLPTTDPPQNGWSALDALAENHETPPVIGGGDLSTVVAEGDNGNISFQVPTFREVSGNGAGVEPDTKPPESGREALDALNPVPDATFSIAMESRDISTPAMLNNVATDAVHEDFSDGFGDFVSGPSDETFVQGSDPSVIVVNIDVSLGQEKIQNAYEILANEKSGWDAFDALHQGSDTPLPSLLDDSKEASGNAPDIHAKSNEDLSDGFGDFVSGPCTEIVMDPPAPVDVLDVVSASNGDSFGVVRAVHPVPGTTSVPFDHADSSYYSATAKSVSSDSQDFTNFEDALMNGTDNENDADSSVLLDSNNVDNSTPVDSTDIKKDDFRCLVSLSTDDGVPFNAFDSAARVNSSATEPFVDNATKAAIGDVQGGEFDFGDFSGARNEAVVPAQFATNFDPADEDNDFGDFEAVTRTLDDPVPSSTQIVGESEDDEFGDFGDFAEGGIDTVGSQPNLVGHRELIKGWSIQTEEDWNWAKSQIVSKSIQLPDALRLRANGSSIDFGACFDANVEMEIPMSERQMERIRRCSQILDLLSSRHADIASTHWINISSVVESTLSSGLVLLHDAANLSPEEKRYVKSPLQNFLLGLGEMVRVVRFIAATLADLLLLTPSTTLSNDNLEACWCSHSLAVHAMQIESLWDQTQERAIGLDLLEIPKLESVVNIRSRSNSSTDVCHFSLQPFPDPFVEEVPTQVPVMCGDHRYMACAANLLAHESDFFLKNFKN